MKFLRAIFPPVHQHPKKHPHEWSSLTAELDPYRPLEPGEDGVVAVHSWKIWLDYDDVGYMKMEVN
jgi:hypothetical protein